MRFDATRALIVYSGVLTAAFAWVLLTGAGKGEVAFDTLSVHRLNLTETDGTVRMVMASRDHFPGILWHGQEHRRPDRNDAAGFIFLNDEGTENGGLIFGGKSEGGKVVNFGHLSFDQFEQDQVVNLEQGEEAGRRYGGLSVNDYPATPLDPDLPMKLSKMTPQAREAALAQMRTSGSGGQPRAFFGKSGDRDALMALRDADGRVRLRMRVTAAGEASIEFLDAQGKVVRAEHAS
jgi:hypothetical protein